MRKNSRTKLERTMGLDLGDKWSHYCEIDQAGEVVKRGRVRTRPEALRQELGSRAAVRIIIENGTHSRWVWQLLSGLGHEVVVANPRKVKLIYQDHHKHDRADAECLARLGRFDIKLLSPIRYRGDKAQRARAVLKSRDVLVQVRTKLINHIRGVVKANGARLASCSTGAFVRKTAGGVPKALAHALEPLYQTLQFMEQQMTIYDQRIEQLCKQEFPETALLRQVVGVGAQTSLAYVATIEDAGRFRRSREVGPYLGLTPRLDQSGEQDKQLRISKAGDSYLRRLLVGSAHYVVGPFGPDCDLRRQGLALAERGGKNAKKRAVIAVTRKLSVLLHHLWKSGEVYEPFYQSAKRCA